MENYQYVYKLADQVWLCKIPFSIIIKEESRNFIYPISEEETLQFPHEYRKIVFTEKEYLNKIPADAYRTNNRYYTVAEKEKVVYRCLGPSEGPYAETHFREDGNIYCYYLETGLSELKFSGRFVDTLCLEYLMLYRPGIILHSCFIRWNDKAILFSAPSGTGKSTQGNLWEYYRGAEVLNGDRAGIYKINGKWTACGLPYAGSSGVYRNESAPIRVIVYLAQGDKNEISLLSPARAFRLLYPEILVHHWEPEYVNKISDLIIGLLSEIPVYYFSCKPDISAVEVLENELINTKSKWRAKI